MDSAHAAHSYFSMETQVITMETSVIHHRNMTWMSMVEVNGFATIKGIIHKAFIHIVYTFPNLFSIYVECILDQRS